MRRQILNSPEIVNPYKLRENEVKEPILAGDINLEGLLGDVSLLSRKGRDLARNVLIKMGSDARTINYRQDVFQDILTNSSLSLELDSCVNKLSKIDSALRSYYDHGGWNCGKMLMERYIDLFDNFSGFNNLKSDALKSVESYFLKIKKSKEFRDLKKFSGDERNFDAIDFRVSFRRDENGYLSPKTLTTLRLSKNRKNSSRPYFKRFLTDKEYRSSPEHTLPGSEGDDFISGLGKILRSQFVSVIKNYTNQINEVSRLLEPLDFYNGFGDYFSKLKKHGFDICRPNVLPKADRKMNVKNARHPLLTQEDHKEIVPNDIYSDPNKNIFVITGPNNGGKTTYAKCVALIQLLAQKGFYVPASSAEVSFVDGIYTHFVAPDDITKGEGRYRNELRRVKEIFENATPYSLVVLDEPCGGTSFEEGQRQSAELFRGFYRLGATTYFTTHMHHLAKEVESNGYDCAKNLHVECNYKNRRMRYTYKIKEGSSGKSYGQEIAKEVGLEPDNITNMIFEGAKRKGYRDILRKVDAIS